MESEANGIRCGNTRTIEAVQTSPITPCETCGEDLSKTPCQGVERRTRIDIIFEKVVTHVDAEIKQCPSAGHETRGLSLPIWPAPCSTAQGSGAM